MKCQALSKHTRHTPVVTDMLLQRFTIYHTRRCFLAFTSLHSIGSDLCPSSQALIHEDKTPAPPLHSYALIGQPARSRRACSQCARGVSGALGGSSVRSGSAARAQYNEENTASPHRATLAKGVKEKERESLHLKISHRIWTGSPQPGGGTRDLIYTVTFFLLCFLYFFSGGRIVSVCVQRWWSGRWRWMRDRGRVPTISCSYWTRRSSWRVYQTWAGSSHTWRDSWTKVTLTLHVCKPEPRVCYL